MLALVLHSLTMDQRTVVEPKVPGDEMACVQAQKKENGDQSEACRVQRKGWSKAVVWVHKVRLHAWWRLYGPRHLC